MGMAIDEGWHQYSTLCLDNLVWLGFGSRLAGGEKGGNASSGPPSSTTAADGKHMTVPLPYRYALNKSNLARLAAIMALRVEIGQ